jgi:3-oxoacid CoA-transferase
MAPPKETREFNGKSYVLEEAIFGDYAFVKVAKADRLGNCQFRKAQNNFNEAMGKNAKITIVEADEIVEDGQIAPEDIHLQGIYVKRVIKSTEGKQIERTVFYKSPEEQKKAISEGSSEASQKRERIIKRAAQELKDGMYVNLGIGMPLAAPAFLPEGTEIILESENGILGMGRYPKPGEEDPDLINAGKETVTLNSGASVFGSHESFGMIRSGRIDVAMLGAMQVNQFGGKSFTSNACNVVAHISQTSQISCFPARSRALEALWTWSQTPHKPKSSSQWSTSTRRVTPRSSTSAHSLSQDPSVCQPSSQISLSSMSTVLRV